MWPPISSNRHFRSMRRTTWQPTIPSYHIRADKPHDRSGSFAEQLFPPGGLVAMSRVAYQNTPLAVEKIRQGVFVLRICGLVPRERELNPHGPAAGGL